MKVNIDRDPGDTERNPRANLTFKLQGHEPVDLLGTVSGIIRSMQQMGTQIHPATLDEMNGELRVSVHWSSQAHSFKQKVAQIDGLVSRIKRAVEESVSGIRIQERENREREEWASTSEEVPLSFSE